MIKRLLFFFFPLLFSHNVISQVLQSDSSALVDFYNSTNGNGWYAKDNWLNGPVATWYGITVAGNRVTGIGLRENGLTGTLPFSIGNLTALTTLELGENFEITGDIPKEIGNLTNLEHLSLGLNKFTGSIPEELGNLENVIYFDLDFNLLTGPIPESLGNLTNVQDFILSRNQLTGTVPASLGNFENLGFFFINDNQLSGPFPSTLCGKGTMMIDNNQFTFEGLECLLYYPDAYGNQKTLDITNNGSTLSVTAGGTLSNNTYTWYKDGQFYQSNPADSILILTELGESRVEVTNSVLPALTLNSHPITVSSILPLNFLGIAVKECPDGTCISWSTASELNTSHFEVERSTSVTDKFTSIGRVVAKNTSGTHDYNFTDKEPLPGRSFYRIKQVDKDGRYSYSDVKVTENTAAIMIYPNPASTYIMLRMHRKAESVSLANMAGQTIKQWKNVVTGSKLMLNDVPSGLFILVTTERGNLTQTKIIIR